jgi:hypothetical protein
MLRLWNYLNNVFDNVTKRSFKRALTIITDHLSKLLAESSDPEIQELYDRTKPFHDEFAGKWSDWVTAKKRRAAETQRFNEKITELSDVKLKLWDVAVQNVFIEGSSDYKAVFNNGRSVFRQGTYESRIGEVEALSKVLKDYPALAALQTEVTAYHRELVGIRDVQRQREEKVDLCSDNLEIARKAVSDIMYANLGALMNKFYRSPLLVEKFFDLSLLRSTANGNGNITPPEPITGSVASKGKAMILEGGFDANSSFDILNTGGTSLKFYTTKLPDDPVPGSAMELLPGEQADVYASELGASGNLFLMVYNPDELKEGSYSFMINDPEEA